MRINKFLAQAGVASRRKADELIEEGSVSVNGKPAILGQDVSEKDEILVNGKKIDRKAKNVYIILNKPKDVTSTVYDRHARFTVLDLIKSSSWSERSEAIGSKKDSISRSTPSRMTTRDLPRLYPVGRLDEDSTGLILLTNDGELTQHLTHPKFHIAKTYEVLILGEVQSDKIQQLESGIVLEDGKTAPAEVKVLQASAHRTLLQITLYEGKKRQIRRMAAALHLHILSLKRVSMGPLKLGTLPSGKHRHLTEQEVRNLKKEAGIKV
ncbi:MAG: rRNA pseudouridine synthase [Candidatus Curtissbacteria bacterium]|nr:rRNA pseudouridine synthase [Candidatus Curtissbacteria bacterium]